MTNTEHLDALRLGLHNEKARLEIAKSPIMRELRAIWIRQLEKQIDDERCRLGLTDDALPDMSDDELLAELTA